jgi:hypothetical protein
MDFLNVPIGKNIRASGLLSDAALPCNLADFLRRNRESAIENKLVSCPKSRPLSGLPDRHLVRILSRGSFITPRRVDKKAIAVNPTLGQNNTHDPSPKRAA